MKLKGCKEAGLLFKVGSRQNRGELEANSKRVPASSRCEGIPASRNKPLIKQSDSSDLVSKSISNSNLVEHRSNTSKMKGYTKIAALMGEYPESAIFKRFSKLNIQNVLYLQAELVGLEQDFRKHEAENDASNDNERSHFSEDWYTLSTTDDGEEDNQQWQLALQIRKKLKEYGDIPCCLC